MNKLQETIRKQLNQLKETEFKGWVNIKIDNDVKLRVERLMHALGYGGRSGYLKDKIKILSNPLSWTLDGDSVSESVNKQISAIMILQFLNEIKINFHAPSAGFLFEYFIAGLLPGTVDERTKPIDIMASTNYGYQIKLYDEKIGYIPLKKQEGERSPDFVLVGYKVGDDVDIYQMRVHDFDKIMSENPKLIEQGNGMPAGVFKKNADYLGRLELSRVKEMSFKISEDLAKNISGLWNSISELHYNVEAMLSGVDKDGGQISLLDAAVKAEHNTTVIDSKINEVLDGFTSLEK